MVFSVAVLTCLVAAAGWCAIRRDRPSAWALIAASTLWLPSNNGQLEGRVLIAVGTTHGITQADVVGVFCWLLATSVLVLRAQASAPSRRRWARASATLVGCALIFSLGALAAYETG